MTVDPWRVALHEAGHVALAMTLGRRVAAAHCYPAGEWQGGALIEMRGDLGDLQVAFAGDAAERFAEAGWPHSRARPGRWWLMWLAQGPDILSAQGTPSRTGSDAERIGRSTWTDDDREVALMLVHARLALLWPRVRALQEQLLELGGLHEAEIQEVLK